jgi:ribosome production factor 2
LQRKNTFESAFNDAKEIEFYCGANNTAFFTYTSDTKKKPMNLVLGSLFNNKILDMFEFEVTNYIPIEYFAKGIKVDAYMKPVIIFQGDVFETDNQYERMRKFFLDFFRMHDLEEVNISDLRRVIVISASEDKIVKLRSYQVEGQISEYDHQNFTLTEIGPSMNLKVRNIQLANADLYKISTKQPKELTVRKVKNIEKNALGEKRGRIHMGKQNLKTVALKKYKRILNRKRFEKKSKKEESTATATATEK